MKTEIFKCVCSTHDHHFFLTENLEYKEIYLSVHLSPFYSFFKRICHGIKYIFGFRSRFGDYSETILNVEEVEKLRDSLNDFLERVNNE